MQNWSQADKLVRRAATAVETRIRGTLPPPRPGKTVQQPPQRAAQHPTDMALHCQSSSSGVQQSLADRPPLAATNSAIQTKKTKKNAVGVRSGWPQKQKTKTGPTDQRDHKKNIHQHTIPTQTNSTEQKRAATTAATQSGAYVIKGF